jgi:hypothetical protein
MTFRFAPRQTLLASALFGMIGCSGTGKSGDAASTEAGAVPDGGISHLDGGASKPDAALASDGAGPNADVVLGPGGDTSGGGTSVDGASGPRDVGADVAGGARDAATDVASGQQDAGADVGSSGRDTALVVTADAIQAPPDLAGLRDVAADATVDAPASKRDVGSSTGNALVDRLGAAAAACGPQTRLTVPAGWQMVLAGEKGCAFYAPPTWLVAGAGTPTTFAVEDSSRVTGSAVLAGVDSTGTATCTPHGVASWIFANNKDCVGFKELYWKDSVDMIAGIQIPSGELVYSCAQSGVPVVGYMVVQIHGTWPLCNLLSFAFWMPETQIETRTCTLTQTLNSIQCPQGSGACDDSSCNQSCVAGGSQWGSCDADGECVCS